jgi:hypothetical protein
MQEASQRRFYIEADPRFYLDPDDVASHTGGIPLQRSQTSPEPAYVRRRLHAYPSNMYQVDAISMHIKRGVRLNATMQMR